MGGGGGASFHEKFCRILRLRKATFKNFLLQEREFEKDLVGESLVYEGDRLKWDRPEM